VVTAVDITLGRLVYLPWDYRTVYGLDPDLQLVADAVRASISVPYFFEPATITAADGRISTLVDGGVLANYPIEVFDRTDGLPPRWPTFGAKILPRLPEGADSLLPGLGLINHGPVRFGAELAIALLVGRDQARLDLPWVAARTMQIDGSGVGPLDFGLSDAERDLLFGRGVEAAEEFVATWDWADYLERFRDRS
jgi:NTE family protein